MHDRCCSVRHTHNVGEIAAGIGGSTRTVTLLLSPAALSSTVCRVRSSVVVPIGKTTSLRRDESASSLPSLSVNSICTGIERSCSRARWCG